MSTSADAGWGVRADGGRMPYLTNSLIPGGSLDDYHAITAALPDDRPEGMVARYAGMAPEGLAITVVWTSKAHADRFEAEQLLPTARRVLAHAPPDERSTFFSYEATDVVFGAAEVPS
jgi:hypothetical protein